jgi:hypothetical protein
MPGASETETSPLFEIALVLVRLGHVARFILNANHGGCRTLRRRLHWKPLPVIDSNSEQRFVLLLSFSVKLRNSFPVAGVGER